MKTKGTIFVGMYTEFEDTKVVNRNRKVRRQTRSKRNESQTLNTQYDTEKTGVTRSLQKPG